MGYAEEREAREKARREEEQKRNAISAEKRRQDDIGFIAFRLAKEALTKRNLRNPDAQYYNLCGVSINRHDPIEGNILDLSGREASDLGFDLFPSVGWTDLDKKKRKEIQQEILKIIQERKFSFQDLIQYIMTDSPEEYRVVLLLDSSIFQKAIRKQGTWVDTNVMADKKKRKDALDNLESVMHGVYTMRYDDFIQLVSNELPSEYTTFIFEYADDVLDLYKRWRKDISKKENDLIEKGIKDSNVPYEEALACFLTDKIWDEEKSTVSVKKD